MRAMIFSDLITSRNSSIQTVGITVFVSLFIAAGTETLVTAVAAMSAMVPFMYLFTISAFDEQNGWERFRLTLPITRRQVAFGRYASMLIVMACALVVSVVVGLLIGCIAEILPDGMAAQGLFLSQWELPAILGVGALTQVVILLVSAVSLPLIMRYGMTKGSRLVPVIMVFALCIGVTFFGSNVDALDLDVLLSGEYAFVIFVVAALAVSLVVYGMSACVSARLYESREL